MHLGPGLLAQLRSLRRSPDHRYPRLHIRGPTRRDGRVESGEKKDGRRKGGVGILSLEKIPAGAYDHKEKKKETIDSGCTVQLHPVTEDTTVADKVSNTAV